MELQKDTKNKHKKDGTEKEHKIIKKDGTAKKKPNKKKTQ